MAESIAGPLSHRRFRALWLASVLSNVGGFLQSVAAAWLMLDLTGSPVWVSAMAASTTLPLLFLSLPAGALADLANRRNMLLATQILMGGTVLGMAALEAFDAVTPAVLLGLGLLLGVGVAFNAPIWQSMVPDLVPRQMVASAVALNSMSFNAARVIGPALGGVIVAAAGPALAFGLNAVTYLGVIVVVFSFPPADWRPEEESTLARAIAFGVRYTRFTPSLRWLLAISAGFGITGAAVQTLLPNLTKDSLGGGAGLYGLLLGAMGIGALFGALSRAVAAGRLGRRMVPVGVALYGAVGIVVGVSGRVWVTAAAMAVAGLAWVWTLATLNATIQLLSHRWVRGRTLSLYMLAFSGVYPLGALLAGALGDAFGLDWSIAGLSAGAVLLGAAATRMPIPDAEDLGGQEIDDEYDRFPHGSSEVVGGPVLVLNTWVIAEDGLEQFLDAIEELRIVRLRTGAYRWVLYRNVEDPHRMTEAFSLPSWEEHLRQHERIDTAAAEVIRRAGALDVRGAPVSRHLVGFDLGDRVERPDWEELALHHRDAHDRDGSIPLMDPDEGR